MVGGARVRGQRICVCPGAGVRGQRSTGWRLRCTDCCKVVPDLLHALYSGTLLREVKGQVQLV